MTSCRMPRRASLIRRGGLAASKCWRGTWTRRLAASSCEWPGGQIVAAREENGPMTKAIQQSVRFAAPPEELFEMYLDSKKHSESTGGVARMSRKTGGKFTAWHGQLAGRNLFIVPTKLIVQTWRSTHWPASDPDSILIL